jgi:uncharacterized lipoprotein YajG
VQDAYAIIPLERLEMKLQFFVPLAACLALGACAVPPTAPRVTAVATDKTSDKAFARDDAACRAKAQSVTDREAAAGQGGLQAHYDEIYADCMMNKGYDIEAMRRRHYYAGPGSFYAPVYGPGPYWGPSYGYGYGYGFGGRRW